MPEKKDSIPAVKPRSVGGSFSVKPKFNLDLKNEKIEEEQEEVDESPYEEKPKEKQKQANLSNFMQEF